jgi:hypothetical protein
MLHILEVHFLDCNTAFFEGPLEEEINVSQPSGFEDSTRRILRFNRTLYGLKQAANAWHKAFVGAIRSIGYQRRRVDREISVRKT